MARVHTKPQFVFTSLDDRLPFGRYKGLTLDNVIDEAPDYIVWMHENNIASIPDEILKDAYMGQDEMRGSYSGDNPNE